MSDTLPIAALPIASGPKQAAWLDAVTRDAARVHAALGLGAAPTPSDAATAPLVLAGEQIGVDLFVAGDRRATAAPSAPSSTAMAAPPGAPGWTIPGRRSRPRPASRPTPPRAPTA